MCFEVPGATEETRRGRGTLVRKGAWNSCRACIGPGLPGPTYGFFGRGAGVKS